MRGALRGFRGSLLHFLQDPSDRGPLDSHQYVEDGILLVSDGLVREAGPARELGRRLPKGVPVERFGSCLILPGFVDCHVHFAQIDVIASYGDQLLDWLDRRAFPAESRFSDPARARETAGFFLKELLRNGTTTALVFATVHPESVEALFEAASALRMRLISGKTLMDRNAPKSLLDTPRSAWTQARRLAARWHGKGRLSYAIAPRFAPACSEGELRVVARLRAELPDAHVHTHLSENLREVAWVRELFPESKDYLDVYDRHRMTGPRSVFAHGVHLAGPEWTRLAETGSALAFCPSSNLFLGSGLFDLGTAIERRVRLGIGTDVGAGTSLSLLRNLDEAYKVAQLRGARLTPLSAFYLATLGGARALGLDGRIGNFLPGKEADFVVLDLRATPLLERRLQTARTLEDRLFALQTLGDDRCVRASYLLGRPAHRRDSRGFAPPSENPLQ